MIARRLFFFKRAVVSSSYVTKSAELSSFFKTLSLGTYGNSTFVSVGNSGTTWTERTSGTSEDLVGITYGNGVFVTVGLEGTILTSPDGTSWTERTYGSSKNLGGVTYSQ